MMLGEMKAIKVRPIGELEHPQTLLVCVTQIAPGFVDPIKQTEPHWLARHSCHDGDQLQCIACLAANRRPPVSAPPRPGRSRGADRVDVPRRRTLARAGGSLA